MSYEKKTLIFGGRLKELGKELMVKTNLGWKVEHLVTYKDKDGLMWYACFIQRYEEKSFLNIQRHEEDDPLSGPCEIKHYQWLADKEKKKMDFYEKLISEDSGSTRTKERKSCMDRHKKKYDEYISKVEELKKKYYD